MAGKGKRNTSASLDVATLVISIVAGCIGCLISGLVYGIIKEAIWSPLAIGVSFMFFAAVFILIMVIVSMVNDNLGYHLSQHHDGGKIFLALIAIIASSLVLGTVFEFIYEINFFSNKRTYQDPTSYVFIIDNSGSMEQNDPEGLRYKAIQEIIEEQDGSFPYAVYSFSDDVIEERELAPVSDGNNEFEANVYGGTAIKKALTLLLEQYEDDMQTELGEAPKFLLLSDGYATDIGRFSSVNKILSEYVKNDITVSTVGLGQADDDLMQLIADNTGGVYISVDDVEQLEQSMQQAITANGNNKYARTFYTYRNVPKLDFLYALMRIVFTAVLGVLISASMLFATGKGEDDQMIITSSVITGVLAGVILEIGINFLNISPSVIRYLYFILVALTFITQKAFGGNGKGKKYQDQEDLFEGRGRLQMGSTNQLGQGGSNNNNTGFDDDFFSDF